MKFDMKRGPSGAYLDKRTKVKRYLLADTDVALLDENAGVMDRLGQSKLEDLRNKTGFLKPQPHIHL